MDVVFSYRDALSVVSEADLQANAGLLSGAYGKVINKTGAGNDFLGWVDLPAKISEQTLLQIENCAARLTGMAEVVVVIGIGGSYLGARAVIEALQSPFHSLLPSVAPLILYAGHNLSEDYLHELLQVLDKRDYALVVVSKSGTTTEPALAFRILKQHCEQKYGTDCAKERIVAITDRTRGTLKTMADQEGFLTFAIPDDVGGRYSVLTPVGLLPVAAAGFSIRKLLDGAREMRTYLLTHSDFDDNPAMQYASIRFLLYRQSRKIELMASFNPELFYFIEWYKQLFGESEGKEHKGIFPAGAVFSTDLHSLGQYIQQGTPQLFETIISVEHPRRQIAIPFDAQDADNLNYLQQRSITEINHIARQGTCMAHVEGGVPNLQISIPQIDEFTLGELIYFFEFSCALSGYLLDVNPFDQPGVEAYKHNMFTLLGKPGVIN